MQCFFLFSLNKLKAACYLHSRVRPAHHFKTALIFFHPRANKETFHFSFLFYFNSRVPFVVSLWPKSAAKLLLTQLLPRNRRDVNPPPPPSRRALTCCAIRCSQLQTGLPREPELTVQVWQVTVIRNLRGSFEKGAFLSVSGFGCGHLAGYNEA